MLSCVYDPPMPRIEIANQSNETIFFDLHFDSTKYSEHWSKQDFQKFLTYEYGHSYPEIFTTLISTDTVNLVQRYKIPSGSTYALSGWGDFNNDVLYNKMVFIIGSDTIEYQNLESIKSSFARIDKYTNRLELASQ